MLTRCVICPETATSSVYGLPTCGFHRDHGESDSCGRCGRGPIVGYSGKTPICARCVCDVIDRANRGRAPQWPGHVVGELEEQ
jgi:hypothetical protein